MRFQIVKVTVKPGENPETVKVGLPSTDRAKLQSDVNARNRAYSDQDFDPGKPIVGFAVTIVKG